MILADGVMGQAMEPVVPTLPDAGPRPERAGSCPGPTAGRRASSARSTSQPEDLEAHNQHLQAKYAAIAEREVRWAGESLDDAEIAIVAYGTAARVARTAIERARDARPRGRPLPADHPVAVPGRARCAAVAARSRAIVVVELSAGQMVEDVRLAVGSACPVFFHGRTGGMVPTPGEVVEALRRAWAHDRTGPDRG